jgi:hypothetical protein
VGVSDLTVCASGMIGSGSTKARVGGLAGWLVVRQAQLVCPAVHALAEGAGTQTGLRYQHSVGGKQSHLEKIAPAGLARRRLVSSRRFIAAASISLYRLPETFSPKTL